MLCEKCMKNEATIRYEERINGEGRAMNICHECGERMGILNFSNVGSVMENMMNSFMGNFMENMISPFMLGRSTLTPKIGHGKEEKERYSLEKCPRCGYTKDYYINNGKGGCPECYGKFDDVSKEGKIDRKQTKLKELEAKLQKCINLENYEEAARIRDQIKELKKE